MRGLPPTSLTMSSSQNLFPLSGVIGIIDSSESQLDLARQKRLRCVEIRADLLLGHGMSENGLLALIRNAKRAELGCLVTYRHADQGGSFKGRESERVALCEKALQSGADIIDLEHGTDAANAMLGKNSPMILSYHNFERMLDTSELQALSDAMEASSPAAVKIIPTGSSLSDASTMLSWVGGANQIKRIGFTMGLEGAVSRILTLAFGAPVSYASFGAPVAPGQIDIQLLLERYKLNSMTDKTRAIAVLGESTAVADYIDQATHTTDDNTVHIGFTAQHRHELERLRDAMKLIDIVNL